MSFSQQQSPQLPSGLYLKLPSHGKQKHTKTIGNPQEPFKHHQCIITNVHGFSPNLPRNHLSSATSSNAAGSAAGTGPGAVTEDADDAWDAWDAWGDQGRNGNGWEMLGFVWGQYPHSCFT